jgi:hypothetical protein
VSTADRGDLPGGHQGRRTPVPLLLAALVTAAEALALVVLGVLELAGLSTSRATMGLTTAVFFLLYGGGLGWCAWSLRGLQAWARAPVVLSQLIQLGVAWSFRSGSTALVAAVLAVTAVLVLAGVFVRASIAALDAEDA